MEKLNNIVVQLSSHGKLVAERSAILRKRTHHEQVQEDHLIFTCKICMDLIQSNQKLKQQ